MKQYWAFKNTEGNIFAKPCSEGWKKTRQKKYEDEENIIDVTEPFEAESLAGAQLRAEKNWDDLKKLE